jgi:hypothetical protein
MTRYATARAVVIWSQCVNGVQRDRGNAIDLRQTRLGFVGVGHAHFIQAGQ